MKRFASVLSVLLLSAVVPAYAGSFGVYGGYWDSDDFDETWGGGVRVGFDFFKWMELEFHGTWFDDFEQEIGSVTAEASVMPVDGGLKFNFLPERKVNVFVGAGVTYYFLDVDVEDIEVDVDDEFGYYAQGGLSFGGEKTKFFGEVMYRILEATVDDGSSSEDVNFDGFSINVGVNWGW